MIDPKIWKDQAEFNAQLRALPDQPQDRTALVKDFGLHMVTEIAELMTAANAFGVHRRPEGLPLINGENVRRQLIDIQKYWMSICQLFEYTPELMEQTYWRKSATVRQRFAEEWMTQLTGPTAILDLDGVLCDYYAGMANFIQNESPWSILIPAERMSAIRSRGAWIDAHALELTVAQWAELQHQFRTQGGFRNLPPMPCAQPFLHWCRAMGYHIVVMTSRTIGDYPNIYDDTVEWFARFGITCDKIWWGSNKAEKLERVRSLIQDIAFVVDDDPRFIKQFRQHDIKKIFWYRQAYHTEHIDGVIPVFGLDSIQKEMTA